MVYFDTPFDVKHKDNIFLDYILLFYCMFDSNSANDYNYMSLYYHDDSGYFGHALEHTPLPYFVLKCFIVNIYTL